MECLAALRAFNWIMTPARVASIALLSLTACRGTPTSTEQTAPPPPSAGASASVTATSTAEPAPPPPLIDLLYRTKARVAVTSNVSNPKDYPEHLIDRRPETAWNGKTGDLDARVLFRVPASARVRRLLLTVGYDKTTKEGDLFFMNHRVAQVALSHEGRLVGTFDLDPENRKPQAIEIDEPGGTFELRATRTVPGTKSKWREIVLSELSVLGTAPDDELLAPAMPQVTIGTLDRAKSDPGPFEAIRAGAPFASLEAFCAAHVAAESKILERIKAKDPYDVHVAGLKAYCQRQKERVIAREALSAPFEKLAVASLLEGGEMVERLVIKTDKGFYPTPITFAIEYPGPGCGMSSGYRIDSAAAETSRGGRPILTLQVTKHAAALLSSPNNFESAGAFFIACALDAGGAPVCREELVASFDGDGSWTLRMLETQKYDVHPPRWDWKREASVDDDGQIRLSPCLDAKGRPAACGRRNADLLRRF